MQYIKLNRPSILNNSQLYLSVYDKLYRFSMQKTYNQLIHNINSFFVCIYGNMQGFYNLVYKPMPKIHIYADYQKYSCNFFVCSSLYYIKNAQYS